MVVFHTMHSQPVQFSSQLHYGTVRQALGLGMRRARLLGERTSAQCYYGDPNNSEPGVMVEGQSRVMLLGGMHFMTDAEAWQHHFVHDQV